MKNDILGKDLLFISRILRDGSGVIIVEGNDMTSEDNTRFRMSCLSITNGTYIASEMNSYVVKLKTP